MPSSLHSGPQHRTAGEQPTIERVQALLDCFDVDAIESIWNPEPILEAPSHFPVLPDERPTPEAKGRSLLDERAMADAFSNRYLLPLFDPPADAPLPIDPAVAGRLDASYCRQHTLAPLAEEHQTLEVAIAFPEALQLADDFHQRYGKQLRPLFAPQSVIERILQLLYPNDESSMAPALVQTAANQPISSADAARPRWLQRVLASALNRNATAIHLDRIGDLGEVRFRVDGRLASWKRLGASEMTEILGGLKARAKLNGDPRSPQSGSFQIRKGGQRISALLDTCPTVDGERTVLHFQHAAGERSRLDQLGFGKRQHLEVRDWLTRPPGLVLVSSPAAHGRTTTLYSLLSAIARPEASVAAIETKVERRLQNVQQLQVVGQDGLAFSEGMRALLKQDLDVIMVDELRDAECLDLCLAGCSAGSTVIAGLQASSPLALVRRLLAWSTDRGKFAAELRGVVFQRLLRRLCYKCRRPQALDSAKRQQYGIPLDCTLYQPIGCSDCGGRGYRGRIAAFSLYAHESELLRDFTSGAPLAHFQRPSPPSATNSLFQAAVQRVIAGETSLAEATRLMNG